MQVDSVALGLLDPEDHLFPDQTKKFVQECERMIEISMGKSISVLTPLIEFSKSDVLAMARMRGLQGTYSCHAGGSTPCGVCVACVEIKKAKERS
jgi:7-cyano-7-deazaguanine synthase